MNSNVDVDRDEIFEILSSSRRRRTLYHLHERGGHADLPDIAHDIAIDEHGDPVPDHVEKRLYISLYQTHVPKLEDTGMIEYDPESREITLTDRIHEISRLTDGNEGTESESWITIYAGCAILGVILIGGIVVDLIPVPVEWAALLLAVVFLLIAGTQWYVLRRRAKPSSFPELLAG